MYTVGGLLRTLRISDSLTVGEILHSKGLYSNPHSARVNAQKKLNELVAIGKLERGNGYYRTPDCKSEYGDHARALTKTLTEVLKTDSHPLIHRELYIPEVSIRPDAVILLTKENQGLCFILEVALTETEEYLTQKINIWKNWAGASVFLSGLFNFKIPHFDIVVEGETVPDGAFEFNSYLEEING